MLQIVKTPGRERDLGAVGLEVACPEDITGQLSG